jgi:hypothetical protein
MTGEREGFVELDSSKVGTIKFGDGSTMDIKQVWHGAFQVPERRTLRTNGRLLHLAASVERHHQWPTRPARMPSPRRQWHAADPRQGATPSCQGEAVQRLSTCSMSTVCLTKKVAEDPWLWHAHFGHLNFNTLGRMAEGGMVHRLLHIKHAGKLCDSC